MIEPSFSLPPLAFCRGVDPSQAEKSRPDLKAFGSGTLATIAEAVIFPTPSTDGAHRHVDPFRQEVLKRQEHSRIETFAKA